MGLKRYIFNWYRHDSRCCEQLGDLHFQIARLRQILDKQNREFKEFQRKSYLQERVLNCDESGVSNSQLCDEEVIVSLTSYGKRIYEVYLPIESIMQGTVKPNRIILWLSEDIKNIILPETLQRQQKRGLQIEYCKDLRSYKKLIPTLLKYPDSTVITIDDDAMYDFDLVENLLRTHNTHPGKVCANRLRKIKLNSEHRPVPYLDWEIVTSDWVWSESKLYFVIGVGGVLYPPNVFTSEVFNEQVYMDICKYGDDIWFTAMLMKNGIGIIRSFTSSESGSDFVPIHHPLEEALCHENNNPLNCRNDIQLKAVFDRYGIYDYFLC